MNRYFSYIDLKSNIKNMKYIYIKKKRIFKKRNITIFMPDRLIWGGLLLHLKFLLNPPNIQSK